MQLETGWGVAPLHLQLSHSGCRTLYFVPSTVHLQGVLASRSRNLFCFPRGTNGGRPPEGYILVMGAAGIAYTCQAVALSKEYETSDTSWNNYLEVKTER